jgi:hypothetical protein
MSGAGLETGFGLRSPVDVSSLVSSAVPGDPSMPCCAPPVLALESGWLRGCAPCSVDLAPLKRPRMLEGRRRRHTD